LLPTSPFSADHPALVSPELTRRNYVALNFVGSGRNRVRDDELVKEEQVPGAPIGTSISASGRCFAKKSFTAMMHLATAIRAKLESSVGG